MNPYAVSIAITLAVIIVAITLIGVGWRNRVKRQGGIPEPYPNFEDTETHRFEGMYVATTAGEDWLERIAAHRLGIRSNAELVLGERGVHFMRSGAPDVHIPYQALTRLNRAAGMAGKFVEKDGLLVVGWSRDGVEFDTGFRARYHAENSRIYQLLASHLDDAAEQETN